MQSENYYDINNQKLNIGDKVLYARKHSYHANGELIKGEITGFNSKGIQINKTMYSTRSTTQIYKL